jgi:heptosyltransferase-3
MVMTLPTRLPFTPRRILIINVARIGDTILMVPVLRALRQAWPQAEIVCLAHPKRLEVLANLPEIDQLAGITKHSAAWRGHFGKTFDLALVYGREPGLLNYALRAARHVLALASGDPVADRKLFAAIQDQGIQHAVHDRLRWLDALAIPHASLRLGYRVTAAEGQWATRWLADKMSGVQSLVGFQVASFPTKAYRNWPLENFHILGERILARDSQAGLLVFGDGADAPVANRLAAALGPRAISTAGQLSLRQTAALMHRLSLYVGVDTGPTHLAGALGVPMVALYHCLHRGRYLAPLEHTAYLGVVEHPANDAEASSERPMAEIDVETVWGYVQTALQQGAS